jgi:D-tagatose-1,6-bisphosphate aldolase subunit GatZ/KbaZ
MSNPLLSLAPARVARKPIGIYSVCSAHPWVIEAAIRQAKEDGGALLIESTSNQVNHAGGYTGMTPDQFREFVFRIADDLDFDRQRLVLGGDHLGPNPWKNLGPSEAMRQAAETVRQYVAAGYSKIHLDTSMACAGESDPLDDQVIADRSAELCAVAELSASAEKPLYIIGTEVPPPGGAQHELHTVEATSEAAAKMAIEVHRQAFLSRGLGSAWSRVVALVVQPGLEFGDTTVVDYVPAKNGHLTRLLDEEPSLVFEAHSTDYQNAGAYVYLVKSGFAILKVGPALTFAMREALEALEDIERQLVPDSEQSHLFAVVEAAMLTRPKDWQGHYHGDAQKTRLLRLYSYSDRVRYYWNEPTVQAAVAKLIGNLESVEIPLVMLSRYLPEQYAAVRAGEIAAHPKDLIVHRIREVVRMYAHACESGAEPPGK